MNEKKPLEREETHICQVGVVVRDLDKTIKYLTSLGLGPFIIRTINHPSATIKGEKASYQVRLGLSKQGPVQLELIEYQKGLTIHKEFLDKKGEGLHHILFKVHNIKKSIEAFSAKGVEVLQQDRFVGGGGLAYLASDKIGGVIMEVIEYPPNYNPDEGVRYE